MNAPSNHPAELADRHASILGVAVLLIGLRFAVAAAMHFTSPSTTAILDTIEIVLAVGGAVIVVGLVFWKSRRLTPAQRRTYFDRDGFTFEAIQRARVASWNMTFLVLVALEIFADDADRVSADFFVQIALAVLLCAFGLKFFALMRDPDGDEHA